MEERNLPIPFYLPFIVPVHTGQVIEVSGKRYTIKKIQSVAPGENGQMIVNGTMKEKKEKKHG